MYKKRPCAYIALKYSMDGINLYYVNDKNIKEIIRIICNNNSRNIIFDLPNNEGGVGDFLEKYLQNKTVGN